jgi:VIT1/CCC1 family predicted Fe2+/Mn2+ transporter
VSKEFFDMCRDEFKAYYLYRVLSMSRLIDKRFRDTLAKAANDEWRHFSFWNGLVGGCSSSISRLETYMYSFILILFGITFTLRFVESMEKKAVYVYRKALELRPDLASEIKAIEEDEERHEKEFIENIDEDRVRYLSSIALGVSDALVELTGIYTGSLGAFANTLSAGLTGLLAGIAASISMAVAAYTQAKHEKFKSPGVSAMYTGVAYIIVTSLLALPYFVLNTISVAFTLMIVIALLITTYMSIYSAVLSDRKFSREFIETSTLILGVSLLLYILGRILGSVTGISIR